MGNHGKVSCRFSLKKDFSIQIIVTLTKHQSTENVSMMATAEAGKAMGGSGKLCNKFGEKLSLIEKIAMDVLCY